MRVKELMTTPLIGLGRRPSLPRLLADAVKRDPVRQEVTKTLADMCGPSGLQCQAPVFA